MLLHHRRHFWPEPTQCFKHLFYQSDPHMVTNIGQHRSISDGRRHHPGVQKLHIGSNNKTYTSTHEEGSQVATGIQKYDTHMAKNHGTNESICDIQRRHPGVQKHELNVNNDSYHRQTQNCHRIRDFLKSVKNPKFRVIMADLVRIQSLITHSLEHEVAAARNLDT